MNLSKLKFLVSVLLIACFFTACKDECDDIVCQNGGTCDNGICDCPSGFFGDNCESITDPCANVLCEADQVCDNGECVCDDTQSDSLIDGVFVINEGNFLSGNSSLSYYNEAECIIDRNNVYTDKNGEMLGDIFQSIFDNGDQLFLVVNNSGKIVVVNKDDLSKQGEINNLGSPRYLESIDGQDGLLYLSDLFSPYVYIVNGNSYTVVDSILVGGGSGQMINTNNKLFIANQFGNSLFIYDTTTEIVNAVELEAGVNSMQMSGDAQSVWVLCSGEYNTPGLAKLFQIDVNTEEI